MVRKRSVTMILLLVFVVSLFPIQSQQAFACSCAQPEGVAESLTQSAAVFEGTVIGAYQKRGFLDNKSSLDPVAWDFEAHQVWKGDANSVIQVVSAESSASCGMEFQIGQRYVVYATEKDGQLATTMCSRTVHVGSAQQDLTELGQGTIPPPLTNEDRRGGGMGWIWLPIGGILLILIPVAFMFWRKLK